jgi:uncharacterized SAM-dependent methyltransferase
MATPTLTLTIHTLGMDTHRALVEDVRTGISVKFCRATIEDSFAKAGLQLREWVVDERQRFAHVLAAPAPS